MTTRWQVRVYEKRRLLHSVELAGPLELGRQNDPQEDLFAHKQIPGRSRLVIARLDEQSISRKHVLISPLGDGRVRVENLSAALPVVVSPANELKPGSRCEVALPLILTLEPKTVRIEEPGEGGSSILRSLKEAAALPQATFIASRFPSLDLDEVKDQVDSQKILGWLQATMGVFLSAVSSSDFFAKAAQAVVEVAGLDCGRVLILDNGSWQNKAIHTSSRLSTEISWQASQSVLDKVVEEKRTFWEIPPAVASLKDIRALVAAPILGGHGEVVGVLYGDRRLGGSQLGTDLITELQARLVDLLASGVAAGLARLDQEQQALAARVRFEQFFTPELAEQLALHPDLLEGRDGIVTVLFCDVRRFSRISESLEPAQTGAWIGDVMGVLSECVRARGGVLVDYYGDGLMSMFGAPQARPDHACLACQAALDILAQLPELNARWGPIIRQKMELGLGIHTGRARLGNTGSRIKFKYGPLGATVNLASRVEGATKYLKCNVLLTGETRAMLDQTFRTRRLCRVRVMGMATPVELFQLAAESGSGWQEACAAYEKGLGEFESGDFDAAARTLGDWRARQPADGPAVVLLNRITQCLVEQPDPFDPIWVLPGK